MTKFISAAALTLALTFAGTQSVEAGHDHDCVKCYYKTVVEYKLVEKPVVKYITKYTDCGKPYQVKVIDYVTIKVPVTKRVKVCY